MSICGYHPFMGDGLKRFAEGLVAALKTKAEQNGRSLRAQLIHEADEIVLLTHFIEGRLARAARDSDCAEDVARGFLGIVYLARFLMADLKKIDHVQKNLSGFIGDRVDFIDRFLQAFEELFEEKKDASIMERADSSWGMAWGKAEKNGKSR